MRAGESEEAGIKDDEGTEIRAEDEGLTVRRGRGYNWLRRGSKDSSAKWRRVVPDSGGVRDGEGRSGEEGDGAEKNRRGQRGRRCH